MDHTTGLLRLTFISSYDYTYLDMSEIYISYNRHPRRKRRLGGRPCGYQVDDETLNYNILYNGSNCCELMCISNEYID